MSLVLNTNINSIVAQNNLSGSQALLSQSLQRLSSGLRINSASDDAAGLAISQQFTTQVNGTNQAIRNANDGVSEAQTTAGALTTIVNNLQSIRTLAVESANGSNSASDRAALNNQVQQQIAEITQIAQQTTFNGLNVLNGSSGTTVYQVGANVGDTIAVSLQQGVASDQIGQYSTATGTAVTANALTSTSTVTIGDGTSTVTVGPTANFVGSTTYQGQNSAYAKAGAINGAGLQGLTASAATSAVDSAAFSSVGGAASTTASTYDLTISGQVIYGGTNNIAAGSTLTGAQVVAQINLYTGTTGVTASLNTVAANGPVGAIVLSNSDGSDITVGQTVTLGTGAAGTGLGTISGTIAAPNTITGKVTLTDSKPVTITDVGTAGGVGDSRLHERRCDPPQHHRVGCNRDIGQSKRTHGRRCQQHHRLRRCGSCHGQCVPERTGCDSEPVHGGGQQPAVHQPEPDSVSKHDRGRQLRAGDGESDPGASAGAGGYLGVGAGQPAAAADPQALGVMGAV